MQIRYIDKKIEIDENCLKVGASFHNDEDIIKKLCDILKGIKNPVLFDIGSNIGVFSLIVVLIPELIVYAFEPFPEIFELLKHNIYLNGLGDRVKLFEIGIFNEKTVKKLKCCTGINSGMSCMGPNFQLKIPYVEKEIKTDTIDNIVKKLSLKKLDFIKIDIEGGEYYILKGAEETIKRYHPMILTECVQRRTVNFNLTPDDIIKLLKIYGYKNIEFFSKNDLLAW